MREALNIIQKSLADQQSDIRDILIALRGDPNMGHTGLIHRVDEHGKQIENVKRATYWGAGFLAAMGTVYAAIKELTKH